MLTCTYTGHVQQQNKKQIGAMTSGAFGQI